MAPDLLWIHKSSDSDVLSRSAKLEGANIRRHVQTTRQARSGKDDTAWPSLQDDCPSNAFRKTQDRAAALTLSLRPNATLGRMDMSKVARSSTKVDSKSTSAVGVASRMTRLDQFIVHETLPASIPYMWQGFKSAERSRLAFFQLRTSQDWAGWQDAPFWNALVLPLSHQSRAVACSLIALSALHESIEVDDECYRNRLCYMSSFHGDSTVEELANKKLTYFEALVSCVVVLCVQNIQGSRTSFRLLRSGLRLLDQRGGHVSRDEEDLIQRYVQPIFDLLRCRPCRMGDLAESIVLSVRHQGMQITDNFRISIPLVPRRFETTLEARNCLQKIFDWGHDAVAPCLLYDTPAPSFIQSLRKLRQMWEAAFHAMSQHEIGSQATAIDRSSSLLSAACIIGVILLEMFNTRREVAYDEYIADFSTIISLIEQALSYRVSGSKQISFGIDGGLVDMIKFVGIKCRDPSIRRRALHMLCSGTRVEGDRVASVPGEILQTQIDLEEGGSNVSSCKDVPETNRWRLIVGHQLFRQRKIELFYIKSPYQHGANAVVEKRQVSLPGPCEEPVDDQACSLAPDAIFGSGFAEYLDDRASQRYFRLDLERFYFPIPKG